MQAAQPKSELLVASFVVGIAIKVWPAAKARLLSDHAAP